MAGPLNLSGSNIEDTYQRVLQTDGTLIYDGTGSLFTISSSINTGSFVTTSSFNVYTGSNTSQFAGTASYALTSSFVQNAQTASYVLQSVSASYAANGGVTQLLAGPNISLSPTNGLGQVTVSSTPGGGGFNTATGSYGSFYSTQTQTNVASTARSMSLNTTDITNGVSISGSTNPYNTYIKTENAGVYDIQFSAQVDKTDSGTDEIWIWIRKNGTNLSDTATSVQLTGNGAHYVAAWNFFVNAAAGDYFQLMWYSPDANVRLHAEPAFGIVPGIPSLIVTANRVDQFLSNTGSFSGSFTGNFTGSLLGTATTASYVLNAISSSFASTASFVRTAQTASFVQTAQTVTVSPSSSAAIVDAAGQHKFYPLFGAVRNDGNFTIVNAYANSGSFQYIMGTNTLTVTSSYANQALSSSFAVSASRAVSSSFTTTASYVLNAVSSSFASTASFVNPLTQTVTINGKLIQTGSHVQGLSTSANGSYSHAEGEGSTSNGEYSHAEGSHGTVAQGIASHAEGWGAIATGNGSHAEGATTISVGDYSHAEGATAIAGYMGYYSGTTGVTAGVFSLESTYGDLTSIFTPASFALFDDISGYITGTPNVIRSEVLSSTFILNPFTGDYTEVTLVDTTISTSGNPLVVGIFGDPQPTGANYPIGNYSHAEGEYTSTIGLGSHAEGTGTNALGYYSHAEGWGAIATGNASHAEGYYTVASGSYQHVQGQYNISSSAQSAFIVGNGTSNASRSNLIFASGSQVQITGSLIVSGSSTFTNIGPAIFSGSVTSTSGFTGSLQGTVTTASYAQTSSFVTGSIFTNGNRALSASYAISSSFATTASYIQNALVTASVSSNTITFTKGNGTTFPITVNTGSGGGASIYRLTSQTLPSSSWVATGSYYTSSFANANITTTTRVDFTPDNASYTEVTTAGILPQVTVIAGTASFYALFPPQTNITGEITIFPTV